MWPVHRLPATIVSISSEEVSDMDNSIDGSSIDLQLSDTRPTIPHATTTLNTYLLAVGCLQKVIVGATGNG
jgi:hypothetical protein